MGRCEKCRVPQTRVSAPRRASECGLSKSRLKRRLRAGLPAPRFSWAFVGRQGPWDRQGACRRGTCVTWGECFLRGLFGVIDDDDVAGRRDRIELQPELLLYGCESMGREDSTAAAQGWHLRHCGVRQLRDG